MSDEFEEAKKESMIVIRFKGFGNGEPEIYFNNVNAFQVMGSAYTLETYGKNMFLRELGEAAQQAQENKIEVAKPDILVPKR